MGRRIYAGIFNNAEREELFAREWTRVGFPHLERELRGLDGFNVLWVTRVSLIEGARWLECVLLNDEGWHRLVNLRLTTPTEGSVKVDDIFFAGSTLEMTRVYRHLMLMARVPTMAILDDEESLLVRETASCQLQVQLAIQAMNESRLEDSHRVWSQLPLGLKRTRIWREMRNRMAALGSTGADRELRVEIEQDNADPFLVYSLSHSEPPAARLKALDRVLIQTRQALYLRCIKAEVLVQLERAPEALALAREAYQLNPATPMIYSAAVRAAVACHDVKAAIEALTWWSRLARPEEIEDYLRNVPALTEFADSSAFRDWRAQQAVSSPAPADGPS